MKHFPFLLFLVSFLYINCSQKYSLARTSQPLEGNSPPDSPKLGVAILLKVQKQKLPYYLLQEMVEMIFNSQVNLQMSDWKPNDIIEWISIYVDGIFDDTQYYMNINKKNILEIHTTLTYKSGLGSEVFHAITFSLIPKAFDYDLQLESYFYDSDGHRHGLVNKESFSILDKKGKFVDHDAWNNSAEQQIQSRLTLMVQRSHSMIREKKYSHTNYEPMERSKSTYPFLLSIDYISCFNKYQFDYGPGVLDTVLFDSQNYSFCKTELHFYNRTKKTITIDSKDFYFISNNDQTQALEDIPVQYVESRGNGNFLRKNTTRNFSKTVTLKEIDKPSEESMELFFFVPKSFGSSNVRFRWISPNSEQRMVEGWIGEIEVK